MLTATMIVALLTDPVLRAAVLRVAHPEEDVFFDDASCVEALEHGFPRLVVHAPADGHPLERMMPRIGARLPVAVIEADMVRRWEADRRARPVPPPRVEHTAARVRGLLSTIPRDPVWVDRALRDLQRASGAWLPEPLRGFARRVMESPARYGDLHRMAEVADLSRGALKARFRRRNLASPYVYLRWFRVMAAAHVLSRPGTTTLEAAHRLGFASGGNLCRTVQSVTGLTPTELRDGRGWNHVVTDFARRYLDRQSLDAWSELDDLFLRQVA
ncbi:MAG: helix-turn-helix domain-containing protein [Gemmatimonadetes bacterium]|nr:helix-turn-helix domain-containing protein [Gemmatimonadota bacterium]